MSPCDLRDQVQLHLDGELSPADERRFLDHLPGCADCAREIALYRRVFAVAAEAPLFEPPPQLTERVLHRVLPSRRRRRAWIRGAGFAYAGMVALSLAAVIVWALQPHSLATMSSLGATASHRLIQIAIFALNSGSSALLQIASGWDFLSVTSVRLAPAFRAIVGAIGGPISLLWLAALGCTAVVFWLRPRRSGRGGGMRHVGVLGF